MKLLVTALAICCCAFAAKKDIQYQDGTLVNFRTVTVGSSCSGSSQANGKEDDSGNIDATAYNNSSCGDVTVRHYTVASGGHIYVLKPAYSKKAKAAAISSFGYAGFFIKKSALYNQMPGAHILIGTTGNECWVKVGKRASRFTIIGAQ